MKIWILGSKGLLGRELVKVCSERNVAFVATGSEMDIRDPIALKTFADGQSLTHAINCAAYTDVDRAEVEIEKAYGVNAEGPKNLGLVARESNFRVIHVSTDYVFDGQKKSAYTEEDPCRPVNVYGKSKRLGEQQLLEVLEEACIVRTSWLFGEGGKNFLSKLIPLMQAHETLQIENVQVNRPTCARDLAEGLLKMLDTSGIWHFASRGEVTRYQIALHVLEQAQKRGLSLKCKEILPAAPVELTAPRPAYSALCTDKIEALLGALRTWEEIF